MPITPSLRHCSNKYKLAREGEKDKEKDVFFFFFSQVELKEMSFSCCLKFDRDPAFRMGVGRSFHRPGTVKENVLRVILSLSVMDPTRRRSLADLRLLEGM